MFQHRHYVLIAQTIASLEIPETEYSIRNMIADHFADALRGTNPQFDRSRFIAAALGNPSNGRDK